MFDLVLNTEPAAQRCFVKKVFLQISENPQEKSCIRVSKIPVNFEKFVKTFRKPPVAASINTPLKY